MTIATTLKRVLGEPAVLTEPHDLAPHIEDWRGRYSGGAACVVLPESTEQVAEIVRICVEQHVPILPQGGNTSLCGGAVPADTGKTTVIISLARMRRIRSIDPTNNTMVVDAGCVLASVHEAAESAGRLYPVSLGAEGSCHIGGTIATNAGGTSVLRYGNTRDNVLGLEVVLADGTIWDGLYALRKNNAGYDLKHLFIGSEGTLGIITGAVLKLHPLPKSRAMSWLSVEDPAAALEILGLFQRTCGNSLSAFELMSETQIRNVLDHIPGRRCPVSSTAGWHVIVELTDTNGDEALASTMQAVLEEAFAAGRLRDCVVAANAAQCAAIWQFRHSVSEANKKAGVGLTSDTAVPVSQVPIFIGNATEAVHAIIPGLEIIVVAHMGDGNVHFIPAFPHDVWQALPDRANTAERIRRAVNDAACKLGGTISAEHGIGQTLRDELVHSKPAIELALMRTVKNALDPLGLFNPGKVLPPAGQTTEANQKGD
jgi:FAD/FMN-containing dehydrogenase